MNFEAEVIENHKPDTEVTIENAPTANVAVQPKIERNQIKRPRLLKQYSRVSSKNSLNIKSKEPDIENSLSPTSNKIHPFICQENHNAQQSRFQYFNKVLLS